MDFYFVITDQLLYDTYSRGNKYFRESQLLDRLWGITENGKNYNNSLLYIQVASYALNTEISFSKEVRKQRLDNLDKITLEFTEEIAAIRTSIWKNLAVLRKNEEYYNFVNQILLEVDLKGLSEEDTCKYLKLDFNVIYEHIIDKEKPDFFEAKAVDKYKKIAEQYCAGTDERFLISNKNYEFKIYKLFKREKLNGRTLEECYRIRKQLISEEINTYNLANYRKMFTACLFLDLNLSEIEKTLLLSSLDCVFELLEDNCDLYIEVIKIYFIKNAPLSLTSLSFFISTYKICQ